MTWRAEVSSSCRGAGVVAKGRDEGEAHPWYPLASEHVVAAGTSAAPFPVAAGAVVVFIIESQRV
jgi:hypothetical protein